MIGSIEKGNVTNMAATNRPKLQTVSMNMEELEQKIREHRLTIIKRVGTVAGIVFVLWLIIYICSQVWTYDSHVVKSSLERPDTAATTFLEFNGNILKYSNDGAFYTDTSNNLIWNQTYEMLNPIVNTSGKYVVIGDKKGNLIYILNQSGCCGKIETTKPILQVKIADQGTVAVLMEEDGVGYLKLYDKTGKELADGKTYADKTGYPLDIALSKDGEKLAVSFLDVKDGNVKCTLSFYNFGSSGQKKINNVVGTSSYSDMIIPQIDFVSNNKMIAAGDKKLIVFNCSQKPEVKKEIEYKSQLRTLFYDDKYIGMILDNDGGKDEEKSEVYSMKIYDNSGNMVKEKAFSTTYRKAEFLSNHEICLLNDDECTIYTLRGVEKYHETWDKSIYKILPGSTSSRYLFIVEGETDKVKLK